jgi:hypothetical protein
MRVSRSTLQGRHGWGAVVGLSTVLTVLVAGQVPASGESPAPVRSAVGVLLPTVGPTAALVPELLPVAAPAVENVVAWTSAGDRLAAPAAAPAAAVAARVAARPAAAAAQPKAEPKAARSLCSGPGWQQRRGSAALDSLRGGAARTGFRVEFASARRGYMGLTHLDERRIEVFVRACGTQSDELLRHVVAHELGHAYDTTHMTDALRREWMAVRGIPAGTNWYGCSGCTDFATPAGDFAEVYAQWARGVATNRSELADDVGPARLAELAARFFGV